MLMMLVLRLLLWAFVRANDDRVDQEGKENHEKPMTTMMMIVVMMMVDKRHDIDFTIIQRIRMVS